MTKTNDDLYVDVVEAGEASIVIDLENEISTGIAVVIKRE